MVFSLDAVIVAIAAIFIAVLNLDYHNHRRSMTAEERKRQDERLAKEGSDFGF